MKEEVTQIMKDGESVGPWRFSVVLSGPVDPYPCWKIYSLAGNSNQKPNVFLALAHKICLPEVLKIWVHVKVWYYGIFPLTIRKTLLQMICGQTWTLSYGGCINTFVHQAADEHPFLHPSYIGMRTPGDSMGFDSYPGPFLYGQ